MNGQEEESAVVVEPAFQNDGVPMGVGPKEITEGSEMQPPLPFSEGEILEPGGRIA